MRTEMNTEMRENNNNNSVRVLTDNELDAVNGGVIPLAVPIVIAAVGLLVGGFGLGVGVGSGAIGDMLKK